MNDRKYGYWRYWYKCLDDSGGLTRDYSRCSNCHEDQPGWVHHKICPNCGAIMLREERIMYTEIRKLILESDPFTLAELYEAVENKGLMEKFEDGRMDTRITTHALNDLFDEGLIRYEQVWVNDGYDYRYRPYGSGCKWNIIDEYTCKSINHSGLTLRVSNITNMIYCPHCGDTIQWV